MGSILAQGFLVPHGGNFPSAAVLLFAVVELRMKSIATCVRCRAQTGHLLVNSAAFNKSPRYAGGVCRECYGANCGHEVKSGKPQGAKVVSLTIRKTFRALCPHCRVSVLARCTSIVFLKNGNRALKGNCPHCQRDLYKLVARATARRKGKPALMTSLFGRYALAVTKGIRLSFVMVGATFFGMIMAHWV